MREADADIYFQAYHIEPDIADIVDAQNLLRRPNIVSLETGESIQAILDTGASCNVGSIQKHLHLLRDVRPYNGNTSIRTAGGERYKILKTGLLDVLLTHKGEEIILKNLRVYLVSCPEWQNFLIGIIDIVKNGLLDRLRLH